MAFGPIMTIQGLPRVSLRPIDPEDIGEFVRDGAMQSGRVKQFLDSQFAQVRKDEEEWYEKARTDPTQLVWGIYAEEHLIGTTGFEGIGDQHFHPYFKGAISGGMIFRPDHWGLGIMSACYKARTWYGLTQSIGLQRIISGVYENNTASLRALQAVGYVELFHERNMMFAHGKMTDKISLELISPYNRTWANWWHGDSIPIRYKQARKKTIETLEWAETNVEFP